MMRNASGTLAPGRFLLYVTPSFALSGVDSVGVQRPGHTTGATPAHRHFTEHNVYPKLSNHSSDGLAEQQSGYREHRV